MSDDDGTPPKRRRGAKIAILAVVVAAVAAGALVAVLALRGGASRPAIPAPRIRRPPSGLVTRPGLPALPAPAGEGYGANVNRVFNDLSYAPAQIDALMIALQATGATVARSDGLWEASEPRRPTGGVHHWRWTFDDTIAAALAARGLTWLPALEYSAPWAQSVVGQDHSPPASDTDYAAYAQAFAARYGVGGAFWRAHPQMTARPVTTIEVWNEPDNPQFWVPTPDASAYARLYLRARSAVDAVDPAARVIVGGLTRPGSFLPAMVRAVPRLVGHIDGVAIHPYGSPAGVVSRVRDARRTLARLHLSAVPLYVTEFGWATSPPAAAAYVAPSRRPAWIARTLGRLGHLDCGLAATILYTWVTPQRHAGDIEDWFGIENPNVTGTRSTKAFAAGVRAAVAPGRRIAC